MIIRLLGVDEGRLLEQVAEGVFDDPVRPDLVAAFFADPRHHLVAAIDGGVVVGFVSSIDYVHPDKPRELWINEVAVAPSHQNRGLGQELMQATLDLGRELGCQEAWVLAEDSNDGAKRFYARLGGRAMPSVMYSFSL